MLSYKEGFHDSLSFEGDDNIPNEDEFAAIVERCTNLQGTVFQLLQNDYPEKFDQISSSLQELETVFIKDLYPNKNQQFFISLFEATQFPQFVLQILSIDDLNLSVIAYRFLDILCYLSNSSLSTFLFENNILDFCFSHLNNTEFDYHLIFSIGSLIQYSSSEILEYVLSNIPYQIIFENPNNLQVNFLNSIVYLYKNIIKFTQTIPYPDQLIQYFQNILNVPQSDNFTQKVCLYNILDFYIEMSELAALNIKTQTSPNFIEIIQPFLTGDLYRSLTQKVFVCKQIQDYHFLMIKLYGFYCKITKYLLHLCKNDDTSPNARQLLDALYEPETSHFENLKKMLEITPKLPKEESELSSDIRQILVFFKIFIKTNPHIMIQESFYNVYEIIFSIIENFQYSCKNAAFDLLVALIKRETTENCSQILNECNMYEAITENLLTDNAENIQVGLDLINILVQKFLDEGRDVLLRFNTEEFFSILDGIEEHSSENHIVEYCRQIRKDLQTSSEE